MLISESVLKYEQNDQPISSESFDDPLLNINNVVEIKMEDLDETPDFFPNLENKDENG